MTIIYMMCVLQLARSIYMLCLAFFFFCNIIVYTKYNFVIVWFQLYELSIVSCYFNYTS